MKLSAMGKLPIGPSALFRWARSIGCGNRGHSHCAFRAPIRRGGMNFPNILRLVQRQTHQPVLASRSERHTISPPGRSQSFRSEAGQCIQPWQARAVARAERRSTHNKSVTGLREVLGTLDHGNPNWDLRPDAGAAACRFPRCGDRFHIGNIVRIIRPKWESIGTCRAEMHTKVTSCFR